MVRLRIRVRVMVRVRVKFRVSIRVKVRVILLTCCVSAPNLLRKSNFVATAYTI